ncbi:hypothetical protein Ancab_007707, partial [Ancistrocladus abbreviatus]
NEFCDEFGKHIQYGYEAFMKKNAKNDAYEDPLKLYDQTITEVNTLKAELREARAKGFGFFEKAE